MNKMKEWLKKAKYFAISISVYLHQEHIIMGSDHLQLDWTTLRKPKSISLFLIDFSPHDTLAAFPTANEVWRHVANP